MPSEAEHLLAYRENLDVANSVRSSNPRWAVIAAFYAAVHLIEVLAAKDGKHHRKHVGEASRHNYLANHPDHHHILPHLGVLFSAPMVARYESPQAFRSAFPEAAVTRLIEVHLAGIEAHVANVMGPLP
jgi:hypothetical protein